MLRSIKILGLGVLVASTMGACELEQEVLTGVTRDRLANNPPPELALVLKQSAYAVMMGDGSFGGHGGYYSYQEVTSDELAIPQKGGDWADGGTWSRAHRHTWNIDDGELNGVWNLGFKVVAETNVLIGQYPDVEELVAEMKILRGLGYLWLLDNFGNVPIITETTTNPSPPTNSRQEVYAFIEKSILDNVEVLSKTNNRINLNYWSAHMILAKLYLNAEVYTGQPKWAEAEAVLDVIINEGPYSLAPSFFSNFAQSNSNSAENMFTLPYDANNAGGFNLHQMTLHYESQKTFDLVDQPWNGYTVLEEFYNSYEVGDVRKRGFLEGLQFGSNGLPLSDAVGFDGDPDGPQLVFTPAINMLEPNAFRQAGVRINKFEYAIGAQSSLNNDFPIFRFADVLLMKAETMLRRGDAAGGLVFVNRVRTRAGGIQPFPELTLDNLLAERGRELFGEGTRRSDLIRFGRFNAPWWEKPASPVTRNLFPIPLNQTLSNPNLVQNPGY